MAIDFFPLASDRCFRQLLTRKPVKVATVVLANKKARVAWVVMARKEVYAAAAA